MSHQCKSTKLQCLCGKNRSDAWRTPAPPSLSYYALHGRAKDVERLLRNAVNADQVEEGQTETSLMLSSSQGHLQVVKMLLASGADYGFADAEGHNALYLASAAGHTDVASTLLEAGAEKDVICCLGGTPLIVACAKRHLEVVRVLLEAGASTEKCGECNPPLYYASYDGRVEIVRELIRYGADINVSCGDTGSTPLIGACDRNHLPVVKLLVESGASLVATQGCDGASPLTQAAFVGAEEIVDYLLDAGADVDKPLTKIGSSALSVAADRSYINIVRRLITSGAVVNRQDDAGYTALHFASRTASEDMTELLLSAGSSVKLTTVEGETPLHFALLHDNLPVAKVLISAGVDVNKECRNYCPLSYAKSRVLVDALLEARADPNARNLYGMNSLHSAVRRKANADVFAGLIYGGCDAYAKQDHDLTPLDLAKHCGDAAVIANLEMVLEAFEGGKAALAHACDRCSKYPAKPCGACKKAFYCGTACQKQAWSAHKAACKAASKRLKEEVGNCS